VAYSSFNNFSSVFTNRNYGYQYGSNKFYLSGYSVSSFGIVTSKIAGDFSYSRAATFASQARVTSLGEVAEDIITQTTPRLDGRSNNQIFFYFRNANQFGNSFYMQRIVNPDEVKNLVIIGGQLESEVANDSKVLVFCHSKTRLFVAEAPIAGDNSRLNFIDSLPLPGEWANASICTRRADDGSGFGVVVGHNEIDGSLSLMSAQYNVVTKKLTRNITNLSIPKFSQGNKNFDIDHEGNMYFDNWANNFQSDSTISIYKASGSAFSVVGQDDILKSGSIVNVRFLKGKVYAAVAYRYIVSSATSSSKKFRIALLRQD
jgi:hypothetical protein